MNKISIREAFGQALIKAGMEDERLVVLDADVSNSTRTVLFGEKFPHRFYNIGIAEANMMSIASGMAASGLIPFVNTFGFLATLRSGEQIRSQIAYSRLNVKICGAYAGLSDSADGASHQSIMDIAVMRSMPNMIVLVPADAYEVEQAVKTAAAYHGPVYIRLSRAENPVIFDKGHPFEIGKGVQLLEGKDVTFIAAGYLVHKALEASQELREQGIEASVVGMPTIKPLDRDIILKAAAGTGALVTAEEHSVLGGLGSAVAEVVAQGRPVPVEFVGIKDSFGESGAYDELIEKYGLGVSDLVMAARKVVERKG